MSGKVIHLVIRYSSANDGRLSIRLASDERGSIRAKITEAFSEGDRVVLIPRDRYAELLDTEDEIENVYEHLAGEDI